MNILDFKLHKVERSSGHEDYWFHIEGDTSAELYRKYMEQGVQTICEAVYSKDENIVGIKRQFLFNYDVIIVNDENLKSILKELAA
jgi:hypothetical protein